ncbi:PAS domain-containing sensor histidine kinase, partial [candidate division KSB1 bacterium]|nr:PAS domain-containing sensor histidine kinase [candidate division KSB1 bacterium]NIR72672.1 PAS domain-containing sensor histidine kinase [candidate division KSB1 bacterium]NIS25139.1 PAS domain-containing sensor histidine kinase [candidate division KSB1 bacterium]NIT72046.1 PAS domain-containing sensor histidine kinase [candidate division KSB1 bacterium]NIU25838.1 PAS domain-containing sensor histidine kinase [candidate division KSB1 bacterium]
LHREFEPRSDVEEYKSLSKTVVNEVLRINDIIQRFLGFARPPKLELRMTNLNEPLNEAATLVIPEASAKGIEISENFERLPEIPVDSDQLKQTFLNLL